MSNKSNYKMNKALLMIFAIAICILVVFVLFPRRYGLQDGGTIRYESFGFGAMYSVELRHRINTQGEHSYYETGTIVTIFGLEAYNDTQIDYDNPISTGHTPEVDEIKGIMDPIMYSSE